MGDLNQGKQPKNILMMMSGSIACAKATGLISEWVKQGHQVQVMCTESTLEFVGLATLEGLSQRAVMTHTFGPGLMMEHIHASRWADVIILCPATANSINKLAHGIADDVVSTTWIAGHGLGKPMWLVPAMNSLMWQYPATQESIQKLTSWGVNIIEPARGELACGEQGAGRMPEVVEILKVMEQSI